LKKQSRKAKNGCCAVLALAAPCPARARGTDGRKLPGSDTHPGLIEMFFFSLFSLFFDRDDGMMGFGLFLWVDLGIHLTLLAVRHWAMAFSQFWHAKALYYSFLRRMEMTMTTFFFLL